MPAWKKINELMIDYCSYAQLFLISFTTELNINSCLFIYVFIYFFYIYI